MTGTIFDIKEFAIHDGPGVRLTVFLKGCPLRCPWCHNPEGLTAAPQLMWKKEKCTGCGSCFGKADHEPCRTLGRCAHRCPQGALSLSGEVWEVEALAEKLNAYAGMLKQMDGGYTLSGGEPLLQDAFALELLRLLKPAHLCIETSGFCPDESFRKVLELLDYVIMDIKIADGSLHKRFIGADNAPILRHLNMLKESGLPHTIRVPLIPGITDTRENLTAVAALAGESPVELLEYNRMAPAKYQMLGMEYPLKSIPEAEEYDRRKLFCNASIMRL